MTTNLARLAEAGSKVFSDKWQPFPYQSQILEDLFVKNCTTVFCRMTRGAGKTALGLRACLLVGLMHPGASILYGGKDAKAAARILRPKLAELPKGLVKVFRTSSNEVELVNGSIIYLVGSQDEDALIGTEFDFAFFDEYRTYKMEFYDKVRPTLRKPHSKLLIASTPPSLNEIEAGTCHYFPKLEQMCRDDSDKAAYHIKCWDASPHLQDHYRAVEAEMRAIGRYEEFRQEYLAEYVRTTNRPFFNEFTRDSLIPHSQLIKLVEQCPDGELVRCLDCSGTTRWGVLFAFVDPHKGNIYILDNLILTPESNDTEAREHAGMYAEALWEQVEQISREFTVLSDRPFRTLWDSADTLLIDTIRRLYGDTTEIEPVVKKYKEKLDAFFMIRELFSARKLLISSRCTNLIDEFAAMKINPRTEKPEKTFDELLDCLRYLVWSYEYCWEAFGPKLEPERPSLETYYERKIRDFREEEAESLDDLEVDADWGFLD